MFTSHVSLITLYLRKPWGEIDHCGICCCHIGKCLPANSFREGVSYSWHHEPEMLVLSFQSGPLCGWQLKCSSLSSTCLLLITHVNFILNIPASVNHCLHSYCLSISMIFFFFNFPTFHILALCWADCSWTWTRPLSISMSELPESRASARSWSLRTDRRPTDKLMDKDQVLSPATGVI